MISSLVSKLLLKFILFFLIPFVRKLVIVFDGSVQLFLKTCKHVFFLFLFLSKSSFLNLNVLIDYSSSHSLYGLHYNLIVSLLSTVLNQRLLIYVPFYQSSMVESISTLFWSAGWLEREAYDVMGVGIYNNKDMRRILTDYGFGNHPLQKEYPLGGYKELFYSDTVKSICSDEMLVKRFIKY